MFLEYVLDTGNLIFRLALRERRRFRTAIEHRTVVSELRHFRQLLGVGRLRLCNCTWWWGRDGGP